MAYMQRAEALVSRIGSRSRELIETFPFVKRERRLPSETPLLLARLIESQVVPRLMTAHGQADGLALAATATPGGVTSTEVRRFVQLILTEDLSVCLSFVDFVLGRGVTVEAVQLDLLARAAERLGCLWDEDLCTSADVSIGLCRLQQVIGKIEERSLQGEAKSPEALLSLSSRAERSFGVELVMEVFQRAGWGVVPAPDADADDLLDLVATRSFALVGLTLAESAGGVSAAATIAELRMTSRNPRTRFVVGGRPAHDRLDNDAPSAIGHDWSPIERRPVSMGQSRVRDA